MNYLTLFLLFCAICAKSDDGFWWSLPSSSVVNSTPTLVQHVSTFVNIGGDNGNPYWVNLPNPALAGNTLIMGMSYVFTAGETNGVSDDKGNNWTQITTIPVSPSAGKGVSFIWIATNVIAGTDKIRVGLKSATYGWNANISEFYNIAAVNPIDTSASAASNTPSIGPGIITTATAGDLLWDYAYDNNSTGTQGTLTNFVFNNAWIPLSADNQFGMMAEYQVKSSAGAITSTNIVNSGSTEGFNSLIVALKPAKQGTAPTGVRIVHCYHTLFGLSNTNTIQFPTSGNLLLVETSFPQYQNQITSFSSSPANTWTYSDWPANGQPQIEFATNANSSTAMTILPNVNKASNGEMTLVCYDVTGVLANPLDTTCGYKTNTFPTTTQLAVETNMPTITPTTNGIIFAVSANGTGPTTNMFNTFGTAILDTVTYGGQSDSDSMDNADAYFHIFNTNAYTNNPTLYMNSNPVGDLPQSSFVMAWEFTAAVSPGN